MKAIKSFALRALGTVMFSAVPGAGVGAVITQDWLKGAEIATAASFAVVISYLGVMLAWNGTATLIDIQEAFRTAAAKAGDSNTEVKETIAHISETPTQG